MGQSLKIGIVANHSFLTIKCYIHKSSLKRNKLVWFDKYVRPQEQIKLPVKFFIDTFYYAGKQNYGEEEAMEIVVVPPGGIGLLLFNDIDSNQEFRISIKGVIGNYENFMLSNQTVNCQEVTRIKIRLNLSMRYLDKQQFKDLYQKYARQTSSQRPLKIDEKSDQLKFENLRVKLLQKLENQCCWFDQSTKDSNQPGKNIKTSIV